jgi:hypothetical protein
MTANKFVRNLKVEVDVTPVWWNGYGGKALGDNENVALLIARAMLLAMRSFEGFPSYEIAVSPRQLRMQLLVAEGTTMERLADLTSTVIERLNELPVPESRG